MKRAGFGICAIACLSACDGVRSPIVFDGQTDRSIKSIVGCLKRQSEFGTLGRAEHAPRSAQTFSRSYFLTDDAMIQFIHHSGDIELIRVRSNRELTDAEKDALTECAPFPDFPVEVSEGST